MAEPTATTEGYTPEMRALLAHMRLHAGHDPICEDCMKPLASVPYRTCGLQERCEPCHAAYVRLCAELARGKAVWR